MKTILLTGGPVPSAAVIDFEDELDFYYKNLECDCITFAHAYALERVAGLENIDIVVDDEGALVEKPEMNIIASVLYGCLQHGQPLFGKALLVMNDPETGETNGLTDEEILKLMTIISRL